MRKLLNVLLLWAVVVCAAALGRAEATTLTAVEFYNPTLNHYFVSALAADIDALDSGRFAGWYRTGFSFRVYADAASAGADGTPVCRFYIPPEHGDSHFFSASPAECAAVAQRIGRDADYSGYVLESPSVFYVALPNTTSGACPSGTLSVYRLWNRRADSNHRYTTDLSVKAQMIALGYVAEGYGPAAVAMCAAPNAPDAFVRVSGPSPWRAGCDNDISSGVLYPDAEVEPRIDVDPRNPDHLIGVWQQDRWSDGGARGLMTGVSRDGGRTWSRSFASFTRCSGGTAANGGDYARASDPWITIAPDGTAYQIAIAFTGPTFGATAVNAVLVSRSVDGGDTWGPPTTLIRDSRTQFNDKEAITADPTDPRFVYAVWDRLAQTGGGPTWFARTTNAGVTWEPARPIYDPGPRSQTINNQVAVLPDGTLIAFFSQIDSQPNSTENERLAVMRSIDRGATWSLPIYIADQLAVGVTDPETGARVRDAADIASIGVGRDGRIVVVWQDSRHSGGTHDAIVVSQSGDGGLTWTPPARINAAPQVQAFVPTVRVRDDGVIGVTYYDFRNNTSDPGSLPTDYWLTESSDGVNWRETHLTGPFDLSLAPVARGYFLGDYQGLTSAGSRFIPLFARTNADVADRTDIFVMAPPANAFKGKVAGGTGGTAVTAVPAADYVMTDAWRARISASIRRSLEARLHGAPPSGTQ